MAKPKKLSHVELHWRDAVSHGDDWTVEEALASGTLCDRTSVGYLIGQTEDGRTLVAQTQDFRNGELRVTDVLVIPTPWVKRIRYLTGGPRVRRNPQASKESTGAARPSDPATSGILDAKTSK